MHSEAILHYALHKYHLLANTDCNLELDNPGLVIHYHFHFIVQ